MNRPAIESILDVLVQEFDSENTVGIVLVGSRARATATLDSDIDLTCYVRKVQTSSLPLRLYQGYLLSLLISPVPQDVFSIPETAIWTVPMWRTAKILLDKTGELHAIQREARTFRWEVLQDTGNRAASYVLYRKVEDVQKLLAALKTDDISIMVPTGWWIIAWLAQAIAMRYGVFLLSEKTLIPQTQSTLGTQSEWSRLIGLASGIDGNTTLRMRSLATLQLYVEAVHLMRDILQPEHISLIDYITRSIQQAGLPSV